MCRLLRPAPLDRTGDAPVRPPPLWFVGRHGPAITREEGATLTANSAEVAVRAEGLVKTYDDVHALDHVDLEVRRGTVLGLLGPNGAGKTTFVRVLTTLTEPESGRAFVEGRDVVRESDAVRRLIGLAGQYTAVDDHLSGRENLEMAGRLYHLGSNDARARAVELLDQFELTDAADRRTVTYSGGMRRRLDLAASLVADPDVLFLDEPTTGLDPRGRLGLWEIIRGLVRNGTTLLLTTQYLEEADQLADRIAVIDRGKVIAEGTSDTLKDRVGGDVLEFVVTDLARLDDGVGAVTPLSTGVPVVDRTNGSVRVGVGSAGSVSMIEAVRQLDARAIPVTALSLHRPSLDDVFLALTGHAAEEAAIEGDGDGSAADADRQRGRRGRGRRDSEAGREVPAG